MFPEIPLNQEIQSSLETFIEYSAKLGAKNFTSARSNDGSSFDDLLNKHQGKVPLWEELRLKLDQFYETETAQILKDNRVDVDFLMQIIKKVNSVLPIIDIVELNTSAIKNVIESFDISGDVLKEITEIVKDFFTK